MELMKATNLETSNDIQGTLNWKITSLQEQDKNISNGLADYFGIGLNNLGMQLLQLKELEAEITSRKSDITKQITAIKQEGAYFLESQGIDKLEGVLTSSVTITKGKSATTKKKFTLLVSKKESEEYLIDAGLAVYEKIDVPETVNILRVNRRKTPLTEVEEIEEVK